MNAFRYAAPAAALLSFAFSSPAAAQDEWPFDFGDFVEVSGIDVDDGGNGTVAEQRLYQLIRQPGPIVDRQFQIEFLDRGVEALAFTFG